MDLGQILKHVLLSSMVSLLVFLMINVAFAQLISSTLLTAIDGDSALVTIIFLGFMVSLLISIIINLVISEAENKKRVFYASVFAVLGNILLWICTSYPGIIPDPETGSLLIDILTRGFNYLFAIPRVLSYYAIYILNNITLFWIFTLISYAMLYALFLTLLGGKND
jgi:hypothetical protein